MKYFYKILIQSNSEVKHLNIEKYCILLVILKYHILYIKLNSVYLTIGNVIHNYRCNLKS